MHSFAKFAGDLPEHRAEEDLDDNPACNLPASFPALEVTKRSFVSGGSRTHATKWQEEEC